MALHVGQRRRAADRLMDKSVLNSWLREFMRMKSLKPTMIPWPWHTISLMSVSLAAVLVQTPRYAEPALRTISVPARLWTIILLMLWHSEIGSLATRLKRRLQITLNGCGGVTLMPRCLSGMLKMRNHMTVGLRA